MVAKRAAWMMSLLSAVAVVPVAAGDEAPRKLVCERCKPAQAVWPWKANSYVLGTTEDGAATAGAETADALACKKAFRYIEGSELSCRIGCEPAGEEVRGCEKTKAPACMHGSYERDPSMWMFVCRKFKEAAGVDACSPEGAEAEPYWAMCEVHVKAERRRPCDCVEE